MLAASFVRGFADQESRSFGPIFRNSCTFRCRKTAFAGKSVALRMLSIA